MRSIVFTVALCLLVIWAIASKADVPVVEATENAQAGAKFALVTYSWGTNNWGATRYNPTTGEAFYANNGVWVKYPESGPIPTGQYEIQAATSSTSFLTVFRLDKVSGRGWYAGSGNQWFEMRNPESGAGPPANRPANRP